MNLSLSEYLSNNLVPEQYDLYIDGIKLVNSLGIESIMAKLDAARFTTNTPLDIIEDMRTILEETLVDILQEWGIRVNDNPAPSIAELIKFAKTVHLTETTDDKDSVLAILNASEDTLEVFSGLMAFTTKDENWTSVYTKIEDIQHELIERLIEVLTPKTYVGEVDGVTEANMPILVRLNNFYKDMRNGPVWDWLTSTSETAVGYNLEDVPESVIDDILELKDEAMAREIAALVLGSNVADSDLTLAAGAAIESIEHDMMRVMQVTSIVRGLLNVQ